jgi:hypothetical protein
MRSSDVTFKKTEVPIETRDGNDTREMDIIEIKYPDGKVVGFPADMKSPETGIRYRDMFPAKYNAFKNGEPDPDRVQQLEQEIAERQAEIDGMRKAPDDARVQENLGYGVADQHEPFDHMTKAEINEWIARHSDELPPSDATKDELVKFAKRVERKQAKEAA